MGLTLCKLRSMVLMGDHRTGSACRDRGGHPAEFDAIQQSGFAGTHHRIGSAIRRPEHRGPVVVEKSYQRNEVLEPTWLLRHIDSYGQKIRRLKVDTL